MKNSVLRQSGDVIKSVSIGGVIYSVGDVITHNDGVPAIISFIKRRNSDFVYRCLDLSRMYKEEYYFSNIYSVTTFPAPEACLTSH